MTKGPPWMPFNVGDYLRDTGHLGAAEHGAYMLLIMRYWQDGGLPSDERLIARYSKLTPEQWAESRDIIAALFGEGWRHGRIDAELAKAEDIINKRRSAAEQRHTKSNASAEQAESTSAYTGVPHSPEPQPEDKTPAPHSSAAGGRDLFDDIWQVFPCHPASNEPKARKAFGKLSAKDQAALLPAAQRFRGWFVEDCERRKRTVEAGLQFAPHLSTWVEGGAWRKADDLPVSSMPTPAQIAAMAEVITLDRIADEALFKACEQIRDKPVQSTIQKYSFPKEIVAQARQRLGAVG